MDDLSLHILDIAQNSLQAGARNLEISIEENEERDELVLTIRDDGAGMTEDEIAKVLDPFYTSRDKKVGLGIPLLAQSAREADGEVSIESTPGQGTVVKARFRLNHIDRKPLGDLTSTVKAIIGGNPGVDLVLKYRKNREEFLLDTRELRKHLGETPLNYPLVLRWIGDLMNGKLSGSGDKGMYQGD